MQKIYSQSALHAARRIQGRLFGNIILCARTLLPYKLVDAARGTARFFGERFSRNRFSIKKHVRTAVRGVPRQPALDVGGDFISENGTHNYGVCSSTNNDRQLNELGSRTDGYQVQHKRA